MNKLLTQVLLYLGITKQQMYSEHCKAHEQNQLYKPRLPKGNDPRLLGAFGSIEELLRFTYGVDPYMPRPIRVAGSLYKTNRP